MQTLTKKCNYNGAGGAVGPERPAKRALATVKIIEKQK